MIILIILLSNATLFKNSSLYFNWQHFRIQTYDPTSQICYFTVQSFSLNCHKNETARVNKAGAVSSLEKFCTYFVCQFIRRNINEVVIQNS